MSLFNKYTIKPPQEEAFQIKPEYLLYKENPAADCKLWGCNVPLFEGEIDPKLPITSFSRLVVFDTDGVLEPVVGDWVVNIDNRLYHFTNEDFLARYIHES